MPAKARCNDYVDIQCPHDAVGIICTGSSTVTDCGQQAARFSDEFQCTKCGSTGFIIAGSPTTKNDALRAARETDRVLIDCQCPPGDDCGPHDGQSGEIMSGSGTTIIDG